MPTTAEIEAARQRLANGTGTAADNATYYDSYRANQQQKQDDARAAQLDQYVKEGNFSALQAAGDERGGVGSIYDYNTHTLRPYQTLEDRQNAYDRAIQAAKLSPGAQVVQGTNGPILQLAGGGYVSPDAAPELARTGALGQFASFDPYAGGGYQRPNLPTARRPGQPPPAPPTVQRPGQPPGQTPAGSVPGTNATGPAGGQAPRPGTTPNTTAPSGTTAPRPGGPRPGGPRPQSERQSVGGYSDRQYDLPPDSNGDYPYPTGRVGRANRGDRPSSVDRQAPSVDAGDVVLAGAGSPTGGGTTDLPPDASLPGAQDGNAGGAFPTTQPTSQPAGDGSLPYTSAGGYTPNNGAANPYFNPTPYPRPNTRGQLFWENSRDPLQLANQLYRGAFQRGDELDTDFAYDQSEQRGRAQALNLTGDELYAYQLQHPGYTPQEASDILRDQDLQGLQQNDAERNAAYLTPEEQAAIAANPEKIRGWFNPQQHWNMFDAANLASRGAQGDQANQMRTAYQEMGKYLDIGANSPDLNVSPEHKQFVGDALDYLDSNVRSVVNPNDLRASQEYLNNYRFSPADVEAYANQAGRTAGQVGQSAEDRLYRSAAAAGNANPLAIAAAGERMRQDNASAAANSVADARLRGTAFGLNITQGREDTRLGAEQRLAAQRAADEMQLGTTRLGAGERLENLRLGSAQDISSRRMQAVGQTGQARLGAEQYLGNSGLDLERDIGRQGQGIQQYISSTGIPMEQYIDTANSNRATGLAQNRQGTEQYNQGQRFNRGWNINQAASGRASQVAGTRRQDLAEVRGDVRTQAGNAAQQQFGAGGQRISTMGAMFGAANNAAQQTLSQSRFNSSQPPWWATATGAAGQAATAAGNFKTPPFVKP